MTISIRLEAEKDYKDVEFMTREAFWNVYKPGCDEHLIVHNIRKVPAYISELSFVACDDGALTSITGQFYEDKVFEVEKEELEIYEESFPYKDKMITDTQL